MNTATGTYKSQGGLRTHAGFMIGGLVIQYTLGMLTNLFVKFPDSGQEGQMWEFAWSQLPTAAHIITGSLLFIGAVVLVIRAARQGSRSWILSSAVGLAAIVSAIYGGVRFIPSQVDAYSLLMALSAIVAILAYGWGLVAERG
jgi:hypothetical protein